MTIQISENPSSLADNAASLITNLVNSRPDAVICIASGHTPIPALERLVTLAKKSEADFSRCHFIGLDEWVGIPLSGEGSCRYFLDEYFLKPLQIPESHIHFFDGMAADLAAECRKMDNTIARLGGLNLMLAGIGMNGHIALNEPGTPWNHYSHIVDLHDTTITVGQKYFSKETQLEKGITLGLQYLKEAGQAVLMASGKAKAPIVRQALEEKVTEQVPASIFQTLEHGVVLLDSDAAFELQSSRPYV